MKAFRYDTSKKWFKGNTHLHSTASDGGLGFSEIAELYAGAGYDFLFATDHNIISNLEQEVPEPPVLWFDAVELDGVDHDGTYYHIVCLGKIEGYSWETPFPDAVKMAFEQKVFSILAHPFWTGNSLEDAAHWPFDGVEIYNHIGQWLNGKGDGRVHWNDMLLRNPDTLAFAVDDAHLKPEHPGWNGGWIVVNAAERTRESIFAAIRCGNYYSSCGPEFHDIALKGGKIRISTSPVQMVRLVGPGRNGKRIGSFDGKTITEASFDLPEEWDFAYLEIEDRCGKRAWTNTLFSK